MCGIAGIASSDGSVSEEVVVRMRDSMSHRGPDDAGSYVNGRRTVGLGHRRLSIIDLSSAGHQPMCNEAGDIWLTYNGEIYNYKELKADLVQLGHRFRSESDSEVLVHAYQEWGHACVSRLRGMFAFAIWNEREQELFLARDRMGIKPLFYAHTADSLLFASELKGITSSRLLDLSLDHSGIYDFFTYGYIPTPKTIYNEVRKLPPAHFAVYSGGKLKIQQYWDVEFHDNNNVSEADAIATVRDRLRESVDYHLISDVPVGVMLSGGLDSGSLTSLAATSATGLSHTFTIGFDVDQHDETALAALVAKRYDTKHFQQLETFASAEQSQDRVIEMFDEPFADSSAIPTLSVCSLARKEVKVALSGEGGDELFGGYTRYSKWLKFGFLDWLPDGIRKNGLGSVAGLLPNGFKGKWSLQLTSMQQIPRYAELLSASLKEDKEYFLSDEFARQFSDYDDYWYLRQHWRPELDRFSRMQYLDMKTYLHDMILTKMDRASMAVSLEARVPLLDHVLIESVLAFGSSIRNRHNEKKYLLKRAVADLLPPELLQKKKQGFSLPFYAWLDKPEARVIDPAYEAIFNKAALGRDNAVSPRNFWKLRVMNTWLYNHA